MARIRVDRRNGWLLPTVEAATECWMHYLSFGSWAGVFHFRINSEIKRWASPQSDSAYMTAIVQDNIRHDTCWLIMAAASAGCFFVLEPHTVQSPRGIAAFAFSAWRALDLFVNSVRLPIFGLKNNPNQREAMDLPRAQRRFILSLIHLLELIFNYAVIFWALSFVGNRFTSEIQYPAQALHLSFSTLTTIGYGNYSPVSRLSIGAATLESFTGLLWIAGIISQMAAGTHGDSEAFKDEFKFVSAEEWARRRWFPPLATLGIMFVLLGLGWHLMRGDGTTLLRAISCLLLLTSGGVLAFVFITKGLGWLGIRADRSDSV